MKILHIIRNPNDATPLEIAKAQGREHEVAVLLLHDGVYLNPENDAKFQVYASASDALARGVPGHECVNYKQIAKMLFEYDKVISW
jgi:sulfur transfer complex TusBCD TusB component (DsrH family)